MRPALGHAAVFQHEDAIGFCNRRQTMRDHDDGAAFRQLMDNADDGSLAVRIHVRGRFVEYIDGGIVQKRPGKRQTLTLPAREVAALLGHGRIKPARCTNEPVDAATPQNVPKLVIARLGARHQKIGAHRSGEQVAGERDDGHRLRHALTGNLAERHAADTFKGGDKKGDMKVINVMTANALDAAKWCRDYLGVRFEDDNLFFFGGHSRKRALIPVGHTGTEFIAKFQAKADELGIPVITDMKAEELIKDKTGRVVGVKATSHGATYTFNAKGGVVLATGGFGANKAMVKKYNPKIDERFKTTDAPGTTGEALYMAKRAGAQLVNMGYIQTYPICDPISGVIELIADSRFDGAIMLNQEGKRFVEELERRDVLSEAILKQTGNYCWVLWNDNIGKISNTVKEHPTEYEAFTKQGIMATCPDLKCIADFTKMPLKQLESTVKRVSSMAGKGNDKDFHHRGGLMDMSEGQYYVIKAVPSTHHTMGGVRINEKAQALTAKGQVIPGLWAAGEVTGVTHGTNRLGGNAYTDIIVFGRIAGEAAAFEAAARSAK